MSSDENRRRFEALALPHLDAAYNLARWLTRNDDDAQDVVQEAMLRALRYIGGLRGADGRPWLLQIVRHACHEWMKANRPAEKLMFDDFDDALQDLPAPAADEPHTAALRRADQAQVNAAIAGLPVPFREVLVLRELEDLSYADIARIAEIPLGTVMSRLSRARALMRAALAPRAPLRAVPSQRGGEGR